jgi:hypothetical protein
VLSALFNFFFFFPLFPLVLELSLFNPLVLLLDNSMCLIGFAFVTRVALIVLTRTRFGFPEKKGGEEDEPGQGVVD